MYISHIPLSINGHLGCLHILVVISAAMNMVYKYLFKTLLSTASSIYPEVELQDHYGFASLGIILGEQLKHFILYSISFVSCTSLVKSASDELVLYFTFCQS